MHMHAAFVVVEMRSRTKQIFALKQELESISVNERALSQRLRQIEAQLGAKELDVQVKAMHEAITKTRLSLWFNSEGKAPTSVIMKLQGMGFTPSRGKHDFVYDWRQAVGIKEIARLGDAVHKTLKGSKVLYKLETF